MEYVRGVKCSPPFVGFECILLEFNLFAGVCSSFVGFKCSLLEVNLSAGVCGGDQVCSVVFECALLEFNLSLQEHVWDQV